jgi:predicted GNAT superfamily acetyltransferase
MPGTATAAERAATDLAERAARAAGVEIRLLSDTADLAAADRLLAEIWAGDAKAGTLVHLMKALVHTDNYVAGAYTAGGGLIAASVAFAWGDAGHAALHSHITGVQPAAQAAGVGYAIKLHQRAWSRQHSIARITWTFDPLVRRNAWFNLAKLGVHLLGYHTDFYGRMDDAVNAGDESDRCTVVWDLDRQPPGPGAGAGLHAEDLEGALALLVAEPSGWPAVTDIGGQPDNWAGARLWCQIPADAVGLRTADPVLGRRWREALRTTMGRAVQSGHPVTGITADGRYLLGAAGR